MCRVLLPYTGCQENASTFYCFDHHRRNVPRVCNDAARAYRTLPSGPAQITDQICVPVVVLRLPHLNQITQTNCFGCTTTPFLCFVLEIITQHGDISAELKCKPVFIILQFAPFSHQSFWRRKRKSCRFPWRRRCTKCSSSTRRTWSSWSRDSKPSTRLSGTRSTSPTRKKPISAGL